MASGALAPAMIAASVEAAGCAITAASGGVDGRWNFMGARHAQICVRCCMPDTATYTLNIADGSALCGYCVEP